MENKLINYKASKHLLLSIFALMFIVSFIGLGSSAPTITNSPSGTVVIAGKTVQINSTIDSNISLKIINISINENSFLMKDNNLISCYYFNNISSLGENNTNIYDNCGYLNGTIIQPSNLTINTDFSQGGSLNFMGKQAYLTSTGAQIQRLGKVTDNITLLSWFSFNDISATQKGIIELTDDNNKRVFYCNVALVSSINTVQCKSYNGSTQNVVSYGGILPNTTYFLAGVKNTTGLSLYINGILRSTALYNITNDLNSSSINVIIGKEGNSYFNGSIGHTTIYNRSLDQREIINNYYSYCSLYNLTRTICLINVTNIQRLNNDYIVNVDNNNLTNKILRKQNITLTSSLIGYLDNNFYSVNNNNRKFFIRNTLIDTDSDGILETLSNTSYHREMLINSGINKIRFDSELEQYYSNSTTGLINFTGNVTDIIEFVNWSRDNNIKLLIIVNYMPNWLADNSSGYCNILKYCPPNNKTLYASIFNDYYNRIGCTYDICEVEVWNEPYNTFFMGGLNFDNINKAKNYTNMYHSIYNVIKQNDTRIKIGGPAGKITSPNLLTTFLTNESGYYDFISFHTYLSGSTIQPLNRNNLSVNDLLNDTNQLFILCNNLNITCNNISITEYNIDDSNIKNNSIYYNYRMADMARLYSSIINNYPNKINLYYFHWSESYKYSNVNYYPEYPQLWSYLSEKQLDNLIYPSFNITNIYVKYSSKNSIIYNTTSNYDYIELTFSKKNNYCNIIVNNYEDGFQNITVNNWTSLGCSNYAMDVRNGNLISIDASGSIDIGLYQNYSVQAYTTPVFNINESANILMKNNPLNETLGTSTNEIWFSFSNASERHIASNLSLPVNTSVVINADPSWGSGCEFVNYLSYTPNGSSALVYTGAEARGICSQLTTTGYQLQVNPSVESNELIITTDQIAILACNTFTLAGYRLVLIFAGVAILLFIGLYLYRTGMEITVGQLVMLGVSVIVSIGMFIASAQNLGASCVLS